MPNRLTNEEFLQRLKDKGITDIVPLEEYKGSSKKIKFKCLRHNCVWEVTPNNVLRGQGCPLCKSEKVSKAKKKTNEQFLLELKEKGNPDIIVLEEYKTSRKKILCKCKICGYEWKVSSHCLLDNKLVCPNCERIKNNINDSLGMNHPELLKFLKNKKDGYKYSCNSHQKIWTKCPDCGYEREITISKLHIRGYHCVSCGDKISFPNKFIRCLLLDESIKNQIQNLTFEWYPDWDKRCLFDVYFEKDNKKYVIEMHGLQHKTGKWGNKETDVKEKDEYKRNEAKKNGIIEIEIDSYFSSFEYIKDKVLNSKIHNVLNLENVNWDNIKNSIYNNIIKQVCEEYNRKDCVIGITDLSKKFNLSKSAIYRYLKIGAKNNWCNYKPYDEYRRSVKNSRYLYELYDKNGNKILEELTVSKMSQRINSELNLKNFTEYTILKMARNNQKKQGYRIIRKENPNKHIY